MPKRQSAEMSRVASSKSRSTIASKLAISCGLLVCRLSHLLSAHCFKLMFGSNYKKLRSCKHRNDKVVAVGDAFCELFTAECVRFDLASDLFRRSRQKLAQFAEANIANHHQINVASRLLFSTGQ